MISLSKHIEKFLSLQGERNFILVRHGESMANMTGSICGWTDVRLTYKGFQFIWFFTFRVKTKAGNKLIIYFSIFTNIPISLMVYIVQT